MAWHIFRKDLGLLWPLAAMVGLLQFASAGIRLALGHFGEPPQLVFIADLLSGATFLGAAILIISAVHQDTVPGIDQDWLVRPTNRGDLVLAKMLFLMLAVQGPMLVADGARAWLSGLPIGPGLAAALVRGLVVFATFDLPIAALATVTTTAVEAIGAVLGIWVAVLAALIAGSAVRGGAPPFAGTGMQWMMPAYWSLLAVVAAAIVIPIQYVRRATAKSRLIVAGAAILAPLLSLSPWTSAFSLQQWFSPDAASAQSVALRFDPGLGRDGGNAAAARGAIGLPLRISGLPAESVLKNDRTMLRVVASDGSVLFAGAGGASPGDDVPVRSAGEGDTPIHQLVTLPARLVQRLDSRPVRLEIDYSLTLLRRDATATMPAVNGQGRTSGFGWCKTRIDDEGDDVVVGCLKTGRAPDCVSGTLQDRAGGLSNPEDYLCHPDYAPFALPNLDPVRQFAGELEFRDPKGLARYPVDDSRLSEAEVRLKSYRAVAHFSRRLVIPSIRLKDWAEGR